MFRSALLLLTVASTGLALVSPGVLPTVARAQVVRPSLGRSRVITAAKDLNSRASQRERMDAARSVHAGPRDERSVRLRAHIRPCTSERGCGRGCETWSVGGVKSEHGAGFKNLGWKCGGDR